ncbi:hypothetical protein EV651_10119 [Kribbella sp. VKM Ac-2571]|uniref:helix-turn-helix transcriptional regulator n=1 Tax=Kribbella sp. VKM Ac-2571 TaxID=2512222 RepID=UPI001060082C|nr:hypothetical protein [Kribbella sp. VKM Ac-2571]TDO68985.1 hypothetical protein EV651_10119 [Kribbella sp. VKM Ac-2571]
MGDYAIKLCAIPETNDFDQLIHDFYEHFDGKIARRGDLYYLTVYVTHDRPRKAAMAAIAELESIELSVVRTDPDLVDIPEIAARLGLSRQAVHGWVTGERRNSFPTPLGSPGGKRIWSWFDVLDWARQHGLSEAVPGLLADDRAHVDAYLADRRDKVISLSDWSVTREVVPGGRSTRRMDWPQEQYHYTSERHLDIGPSV